MHFNGECHTTLCCLSHSLISPLAPLSHTHSHSPPHSLSISPLSPLLHTHSLSTSTLTLVLLLSPLLHTHSLSTPPHSLSSRPSLSSLLHALLRLSCSTSIQYQCIVSQLGKLLSAPNLYVQYVCLTCCTALYSPSL